MVRVVVRFRLGCELVLELALELRLWEGVQLSTRARNFNLKLTRTHTVPQFLIHLTDLLLQRTLWMSVGSARTLGRKDMHSKRGTVM